jgi:DNA polymerase III epsilon subunit-like protein
MLNTSEIYICVDVETAGPIPGQYSLLSIGACTLDDPPATLYIELKPTTQRNSPEAACVHQLSLARLMAEGMAPKQAMLRFEAWLDIQLTPVQLPVFVAFNAPFDWMFVNYYFIRYLGHNPFGHAALDIKALYMGLAGVPWSQTAWRFIEPDYIEGKNLTHHALQDALDQAILFKKLLSDLKNT